MPLLCGLTPGLFFWFPMAQRNWCSLQDLHSCCQESSNDHRFEAVGNFVLRSGFGSSKRSFEKNKLNWIVLWFIWWLQVRCIIVWGVATNWRKISGHCPMLPGFACFEKVTIWSGIESGKHTKLQLELGCSRIWREQFQQNPTRTKLWPSRLSAFVEECQRAKEQYQQSQTEVTLQDNCVLKVRRGLLDYRIEFAWTCKWFWLIGTPRVRWKKSADEESKAVQKLKTIFTFLVWRFMRIYIAWKKSMLMVFFRFGWGVFSSFWVGIAVHDM